MFARSFAFTWLGAISIAAASGIQRPLALPSIKAQTTSSALLDLHKSLIEISSISESERNVSDYLGGYLRNRGFTVEAQPVKEDRQNIFAYSGQSRKTRVLVTSHIDTVPPYWPYERKGDEIWGRGSVDAKGSVAAQVVAVESLLRDAEIGDGDVALLFVVGEEKSGEGMRVANGLGLSWEAVVFGEPTELKLASGHKGGGVFTIKAKGKAGHSGYPEQGTNAIDLLIKGLAALQQLQLPWSDEFGNTTLNVGTIQGGVASNVIPQDASATVSSRVAAGSAEDLEKLVRQVVLGASPDLEIDFAGGRGPVPIDHDIKGFETAVMNYGTDIPHLDGDHKRYLYGPGSILVAHSDHEHLTVSDLEAAVEGYKLIITEILNRD
ncbi:hypothetical protein PFICI_12404 [Pestalotiopsis fici W106-1]|uniref:Peptidase M20 dimerisation domain-containing protein n=1 Tax=Pestalotiopsis fici (strain W106-1 / CGMCC3.15140) TaxID=1229662 RepID=W3WNH1_PESFW|nr:uncharacterized protein PFICI_12404 [Pestalotiopsis fici W106-1]ETS75460.1 hypothetical protein PFICI_12404 [Pestalotiopsis fici W106-1]